MENGVSGTAEKADSRHDEVKRDVLDIEPSQRDQVNAAFENPLANVPDDQLMRDVEKFCEQYDLMDSLEDMKKGARVSKKPYDFQSADYLSESDKAVLLREKTHKWDQPWMLYWLCSAYWLCSSLLRIEIDIVVAMCSLAAATQGMDETANNGALPIYSKVRLYLS